MPRRVPETRAASRKTTNEKPSEDTSVTYLLSVLSDMAGVGTGKWYIGTGKCMAQEDGNLENGSTQNQKEKEKEKKKKSSTLISFYSATAKII